MKYTYLLCHGFGFSNEYWENLIPLIDGEVVFFDENFVADKNKHYIGIGHSIGFQKLNNSGLKFDFLIGLQGFINFCGSEIDARKIREKNIYRMMEMFETDASRSLKIFYDTCQYNHPIPENIVLEDLISDLLSMKKSYEYCGCPALIIGSDKDEIVPLSIINDNFGQIQNVTIETINGIPHSLGFIKAKEVAEKIKKFVHR